MEALFSLLIVVFLVVWGLRIETGINKINETLGRIEEQGKKKEKK